MKKIFILFCLLAIKLFASGQSYNLSVVAGGNYATFFSDQYGYELPSYSGSTGYQAGLLAVFTKGSLSIQTGAIYEQFKSNGSFLDDGSKIFGGSGTESFTVHYLQVPVNFLYNKPTKFGKIFFGGGPYVSFGLSGKIYYQYTNGAYGPVNYSETQPFQFTLNNASPDAGIKAIIGIAFKNGFLVNLSFDHGIRYIFNGTDYYYNYDSNINGGGHDKYVGLQNNVLSLSVGYSFF